MKYISIIICSRTLTINSNLSQNIRDTIGYAYELIVVDNSENKYSIFEAYNIGIEKSKGDYLCFIHDDILFHTIGWGNIINRIFNENEKVGLVGIAGTTVKSKTPSAWWRCDEKFKKINIIQHSKHTTVTEISIGFKNTILEEVVVIDGVFMALRKESNISFSELFNGFHNYDLNISFECKKMGYKVVVTNEILLEHFSAGSLNKDWIESTFKIHNMYKNYLPIFNYKTDYIKRMEIINTKRFIKDCIKHNKKAIAFKVWLQFFLISPLDKYNIKFLLVFLNIMKNK